MPDYKLKNGKLVTEDQLSELANKRGVTIEEIIAKNGLTIVNDEAATIDPPVKKKDGVPGAVAPSGPQPAPTMESILETGFSELQGTDEGKNVYTTPLTPEEKSEIIGKGYGWVLQVMSREKKVTKERLNELLDKGHGEYRPGSDQLLKEALELEVTKEQLDQQTFENYFPLSKIQQPNIMPIGTAGGVVFQETPVDQSVERQRLINYATENGANEKQAEDYADLYYNFLNNKDLTPLNEAQEQSLNNAIKLSESQVREKQLELVGRKYSPEVRERAKARLEGFEETIDDVIATTNSYNSLTDSYNEQYNVYKNTYQPIADKIKYLNSEFVSAKERYENQPRPSLLKLLQEKQKELNDYISTVDMEKAAKEEADLGAIFAKISDIQNKRDKKILSATTKYGDLEKGLKNYEFTLAALNKNYRWTTRTGYMMEQAFGGATAMVGSYIYKGLTEAVALGTKARSLITGGSNYISQKIIENGNAAVAAAADYNLAIEEKIKKELPQAVTVEDVKSGKATIGSFIYDSSANATPTLATIFLPMKGVQLLSTTAKALKGAEKITALGLAANRYKQAANLSSYLMGVQTGGGMISGVEIGKLQNPKQIAKLEEQLKETKDPIIASKIKDQIEQLNNTVNKSTFATGLSGLATGAITRYSEKLITLGLFDDFASMANQMGKNVWLNLWNTGKTFTGAVAKEEGQEIAEQILTTGVARNIILGENINIFDGVDLDLAANTAVATTLMLSGKTMNNVHNILAEHFTSKEEQSSIQSKIDELQAAMSLPTQERIARTKQILTDIGLADIVSLSKLNSLNKQELNRVGEIQAELNRLSRAAQRLASGIQGLPTEQEIKALKDLENQYNDLSNQKEKILLTKRRTNQEFLKKQKVEASPERLFHLALFDSSNILASSMVGKGNEIIFIEHDENGNKDFSSIEKFKGQKIKYKDDEGVEQEADIYDLISEGTNGGYNFGNVAVVDMLNARTAISLIPINSDGKFAAVAALHEVGHIRNKGKKLKFEGNSDEAIANRRAVTEAITAIDDKFAQGSISEEDYNTIKNRLKLYEKDGDYEEFMQVLSDARLLNVLTKGDFSNPSLAKPFIDLFQNIMVKTFGDQAQVFAQFNTGSDVFNYIENFRKNAIQGVVVDELEEEDQLTLSASKINDLAKKYKEGNITTEEEASLVKQYNRIALGPGLNFQGYKSRQAEQEGLKAISREDAIGEVGKYFSGILERFNPETSDFSTWVVNNIRPKRQAFYEQEIGGKEVETRISDERARELETIAEETTTPVAEVDTDFKLVDSIRVDKKPLEIEFKDKVRKFVTEQLKDLDPQSETFRKQAFKPSVEFINFIKNNLLGKSITDYRDFIRNNPNFIKGLNIAALIKFDTGLVKQGKPRLFTEFNRRLTTQKDIEKFMMQGRVPYLTVKQMGQGANLYNRLKPTETQIVNFLTNEIPSTVSNRKTAIAREIANRFIAEAAPSTEMFQAKPLEARAKTAEKLQVSPTAKFSKIQQKSYATRLSLLDELGIDYIIDGDVLVYEGPDSITNEFIGGDSLDVRTLDPDWMGEDFIAGKKPTILGQTIDDYRQVEQYAVDLDRLIVLDERKGQYGFDQTAPPRRFQMPFFLNLANADNLFDKSYLKNILDPNVSAKENASRFADYITDERLKEQGVNLGGIKFTKIANGPQMRKAGEAYEGEALPKTDEYGKSKKTGETQKYRITDPNSEQYKNVVNTLKDFFNKYPQYKPYFQKGMTGGRNLTFRDVPNFVSTFGESSDPEVIRFTYGGPKRAFNAPKVRRNLKNLKTLNTQKLELLENMFLDIQTFMQSAEGKGKAIVFEQFLRDGAKDQNHPIRFLAPFAFYPINPKTGEILDNIEITEEHMHPVVQAGRQLLDAAKKGNVKEFFPTIRASFAQGALLEVDDNGLPKGLKENLPDEYYNEVVRLVQEGKLDFLPDGLASLIRYTINNSINPFGYALVETGTSIGEFFVGKSIELKNENEVLENSKIVNDIITRVLTGKIDLSQAKKEYKIASKLAYPLAKASKINNKLQPSGLQHDNAVLNATQINEFSTLDKAFNNARNADAPIKKIRVFDFDDTLAKSKSMVIVNMPDGSSVKINATEFASQAANLQAQDATFDFTEFSKVVEGKKGPLFSVAQKIAAARGTDDIFILTARPADSAGPIQEFMKANGIDLKLENIVGLGDGTAAAKARWIVGKAAEGYNDFYFADDAVKNVQAVKDALSVIDVKSKTQQARVKFSRTNLSQEFNKIIEGKTGIGAEKTYARVKAEVAGAGKGRFSFFIAPSAEDFTGLLYTTLGKGKVGDEQMAWYKTHVLDPYARAMQNISRDRIHMINDFNALKKELKVVPKDLKKKLPGEPFTREQAVRVYIWNQQGMEVPGLSKADLKELTDYVNANESLKVFADQLTNILKGDQYAKPSKGWPVGSITTDLLETLNTTKRAKYLERWKQNVDEIFSEQNLNKLQAAFGKSYREALENILKRMETGRNRSFSGDSLTGRFTDWLTGSIGVTMFFNTRSAILQTISAVNFINFTDNNILAASRAFANQKQFWADFVTLMNSDFLKERRSGLRINVNEADIADMAKQGGVRGVINKLLEFGFTPTQIADSFAIASGGATFYRNRIKTYTKQGMALEAAERKALDDWRETSEESQQSSRPDRISQQQAGPLGRIILAFANTPAQYARIIKKAALDLKNGRGDAKTNISKIIYYGAAQNLIFNALQQALFAFAFDEGDDDDEKKKDKYMSIGNGMLDSLLRGMGIAGAVTSVVKNAVIRINTELDKDRPKLEKVGYEIAKLSPPVSAKLSRINQAARAYQWHKDEMKEKGWSLDNPAFLASANVIAAATNIPLDRLIIKINNVNTAINQDLDTWQRMALIGGWRDWELGIKEEKQKKKKSKFKTKKFGKVKF